jgi:hypothetical protein
MPVSLYFEGSSVDDDTEPETDGTIPANDNQGPEDQPEREAWRRVDRVALTLARLIGRRMAREDFEALSAANDNRPKAAEDAEDRAEE